MLEGNKSQVKVGRSSAWAAFCVGFQCTKSSFHACFYNENASEALNHSKLYVVLKDDDIQNDLESY